MPISDSRCRRSADAIALNWVTPIGAGQADHADAIGERQRLDEPRRGDERVPALEPADVRLVHRDDDEAAGVGVFVGAEVGRR